MFKLSPIPFKPLFLFFFASLIHAIIIFIKFIIKILAVSFFSLLLFLKLPSSITVLYLFPSLLFPFLSCSVLKLIAFNYIPLIVISFIFPPLLIVSDILTDSSFLIFHIPFSATYPFIASIFTHSFLLFLTFSFHAPTYFRFPFIISILFSLNF